MDVNNKDYKPDYFSEIPPSESGTHGDNWYATTVLEYIISSYRYSCPELYASCWKAYEDYCRSLGGQPGEYSPRLGVFYNGWRVWFKEKYMGQPLKMCAELTHRLKSGIIKDELSFWSSFSYKDRRK